MPKTDDKKKKQDLGIFYTPTAVANFIFDILTIWKDSEDKESTRWQSQKPRPHFPSVVDPAVGEGVFLKTAVERGFTEPDWIFGLDIDENAVRKWKEINILKQFGGKEKNLRAHFFHQNGLESIKWEQHTGTYRYKLKQKDIKNQQFDTVVGNPPYGGLGIYDEMKTLAIAIWQAEKVQTIEKQTLHTLFGEEVEKIVKKTETIHQKINLSSQKILNLLNLSKVLLGFEIWRDKNYIPQRISHKVKVSNVDFDVADLLTFKEIEKLKSFSIEILFTERFLQLAKPGGWIAIIIPDGILTNSNAHYVRAFIADKSKIEAIISLPRGTFKHAGTTAKTSILFLRKLKEGEKLELNYPVFLSSVASVDEENFNKVIKEYEKFYNHNNFMNKSNHNNRVVIIKDEKDNEAAMVRVDKTLKEMMKEKPIGRWSPDYWNPKFDKIIDLVNSSSYEVRSLEDFIPLGVEWITYGSTKPRQWSKKGVGVKYIKPGNVCFTGLDYLNLHWTPEDGNLDGLNYRVGENDLIVNKSGVGTWGRGIVIVKYLEKIVVSQDTMRIRVCGISPYYIAVFLWSKLGHGQQERNFVGVGAPHIDFDELRTIKIPILPEKVQKHIEAEYKKMSVFHDKAMEVKKKGDEAAYKKNIETAEAILRNLIVRTEAVIRGEREDVI